MLQEVFSSPTWLIVLCLALIGGYLPLNRFLRQGYHWKSRYDDKLPLMPLFVFPYLFFYAPWLFGFYFLVYFRPLVDIQQVFLTTLLATGSGYLFFYFWPTYVETPYPHGKGVAIKLLQILYVTDKPFNACPSMHVFMTTILMLFSWQWWPAYSLIWLGMAATICASTVLTKRHYLYDILGGVIVGAASYFFVALALGLR